MVNPKLCLSPLVVAALLGLSCEQLLTAFDSPESISGYVDKSSYLPGETLRAYLSSDDLQGNVSIRLYSIDGRIVDEVTATLGSQAISGEQPWADGLGYELTFEYTVPSLPSGVYLWEQSVPFIVRQSGITHPISVLYPSNTVAAYNRAGGRSLYSYNSDNGISADSVSFLRNGPLQPKAVSCLELFNRTSGLSINYLADSDMEDYTNLAGSKLLIIAGHSEYWTRQGRENFDRFVDEGGHALVLSGDTMWWQVRYSADKTRLICYKSSMEDPVVDPLLKTINWNSPSLEYSIFSSIGADFSLGGYGQKNEDNGWDGFKIIIPDAPFLAGTGLIKGDILPLPSAEYDGTPLAGFTSEGYPIPDSTALGFEALEIIGFDRGYRAGPTVGTWIMFRKSSTSGVVINTASTHWCSDEGVGRTDGERHIQITLQMIDYLLAL